MPQGVGTSPYHVVSLHRHVYLLIPTTQLLSFSDRPRQPTRAVRIIECGVRSIRLALITDVDLVDWHHAISGHLIM